MYLSQDGMTAVMWAASKGHTATVKALKQAGADLNVKDKVNLIQCVYDVILLCMQLQKV